MKLCVRPAVLVTAFLFVLLLPGVASAKSHHHSSEADSAPPHHRHHAGAAKAERLARLAAKEKAAWREHLAKARDLPRSQRLALKRHDRRLKREQNHKNPEALALLARAEKRAWREHLAKIDDLSPRMRRRMLRHDAHVAAQKQATTHSQRIASVPAHRRRHVAHAPEVPHAQGAHEARLAKLQAAHEARVARAESSHKAALTQHQERAAKLQSEHEARVRAQQRLVALRALNRQLRLTQIQQNHNARVAAQRAHWAALHGDGSGGRSIKFWQTEAAGVPIKVITVDLNDSHVKVSAVMALKGNGTSEPFRQMISRANPNVAVTGTFFSLDNLHPVGDIVIDGGLIHFGGMGTALCVTPDNRANMVTCEWGRHHDWSPYDFVVACGPRLLRRGRIVLDPRAERFRDQHMLAPNSRIAVGITPGNKLVFAMTHTPIYLGRLAKVMRALGVTEAMNLDAGTSTGFYYNGATLAKPGRKLTNMIVVYGRKDRYERALDQLVPPAYRRGGTRDMHRQVSQLVGQ